MPAYTFVGFVGLQPGATAVAIETWRKYRGMDRIILLASPEAQRRGLDARLKQLCGAAIIPITNDAAVVIDALKQSGLADLTSCVLHVDAGPKAFVVAAATALPRAVLVSADARTLELLVVGDGPEPEKLPLVDLGMATLLDLHGLATSAAPHSAQDAVFWNVLPEKLARSVSISIFLAPATAPSRAARLHLARERAGILHALVFPGAEGNAGSAKTRVRKFVGLGERLNGLEPRVTIIAGRDTTLEHARAHRFGALPLTKDAIEHWCRTDRVPGHHSPLTVTPSVTGIERFRIGNPTLSGTMVAWMGTDASATLAALWSHRPKVARVFYDAGTPEVLANVTRLREARASIPCGELVLVPSDWAGGLVHQSPRRVRGKWDFNATPGTKLQSAAMAQWAGSVFTIDTRAGLVRPLIADSAAQVYKLEGPQLLTHAHIGAGRVLEEGHVPASWPDGLVSKCQAVARTLAINPPVRPAAPSVEWVKAENSFSLMSPDGVPWATLVIPGAALSGDWFEHVVAACFEAVPSLDEVRSHLMWPFPSNGTPRAEIDVVARSRTTFFVVECKSGNVVYESASGEITAKARHFGRMAIPVIAHNGRHDDGQPLKSGAVMVGIDLLADPVRLDAFLDKVVEARSSLRD